MVSWFFLYSKLIKVRIGNRVIVATELISLAKIGLQKRAKYDTQGNDETQYLKVLEEIIETGRTPAEQLIDKYNSDWNKQIKNLIKEMAY